jgi:hypothetical protein
MSRLSARVLYWSPRILGIVFVIFRILFARDAFRHYGYDFWHVGYHPVPALTILIILLLAWRWDWLGALLFSVYGALYAAIAIPKHVPAAVPETAYVLVIAALFLANWIARAKVRTAY